MTSLFEIGAPDLGRLMPEGGVDLFRDLLWTQARRLGGAHACIRIGARVNVVDGGIDAEVDAAVPAACWLPVRVS